MTKKIEKTIVDYRVVSSTQDEVASDKPEASSTEAAPIAGYQEAHSVLAINMLEKLQRPEKLSGATYKTKNPNSPHALYVTINDIVINPNSPYQRQRPYEIFINSKNMDHFQWIVALTRIISAIFRKGGDSSFLVEEMRAVFDPRGGYFKPGTKGEFVPSLVAEIGSVVEKHMKEIGMIVEEKRPEHVQQILTEKRDQYERTISQKSVESEDGFPRGSRLCHVCNTQSVILLDGCETCLNCGDSKCS